MTNQSVTIKSGASERPNVVAGGMTDKQRSPLVSDAMIARAARFGPKSPNGPVQLIAGEQVGSLVISVPQSTARQRQAMITFAVEDRIAAPIDSVQVVECPRTQGDPAGVLAFVVAKKLIAQFDGLNAPLLPEFLMIPAPAAQGLAAWSVWKDQGRAIVRCADGTGFAISFDMFAVVWQQAGKPVLISIGDPLGDDLPAQDLSGTPPNPDPSDMNFSFARVRQSGVTSLRFWRVGAGAVATAIILHLGFAAFDVMSLRQVADAERAKAERAIAGPLPGVSLTNDITPILARLSPTPAAAAKGGFLPLLSEMSEIISGAGIRVSFRRLAWGAESGMLVVLVQSAGLDELQRVQQALEIKGFVVRSGAANAGDGGAEAEMQIMRGSRG